MVQMFFDPIGQLWRTDYMIQFLLPILFIGLQVGGIIIYLESAIIAIANEAEL